LRALQKDIGDCFPGDERHGSTFVLSFDVHLALCGFLL